MPVVDPGISESDDTVNSQCSHKFTENIILTRLMQETKVTLILKLDKTSCSILG